MKIGAIGLGLSPLVAALALAGCGTAPAETLPIAHVQAARAMLPAAKARPAKVLVVMEENHSLAEMRSGMPFLRSVSDKYGYATDWHAIRHPSEPNYIAIAGGSTFGVTTDAPPAVNAPKIGRATSVFAQALSRGKTAGTFAESMPKNCALTNSGNYAVRHNPWTFFSASRAACKRYDRSTSGFAKAAKSDKLPNVGFLIPNLLHDAHNGTLGAADTWLKSHLAPVLASSDFTSGRLVVVVTADEDDRLSGNVVLTSVLSTRISHVVTGTRLTHYSLTRYLDHVIGAKPLRNAASAPSLAAAFGL